MSLPPDKVRMKYLSSELVARNGAAPIVVGRTLAEHYEDLGLAVILDRPANANPSLPPPEQQKVIMPEEKFLNTITWITSSGFVDRNTRTVGENLGFKIELSSPTLFSLGRLLQAQLIIIEWPLKSYNTNQVEQLRGILFQKRVPYVLRLLAFSDDRDVATLLTHAKFVTFPNQRIMDQFVDMYGELFSDWKIEGKNPSPYDLWRKIDAVVNPKPQIEFVCETPEEVEELQERLDYDEAVMDMLAPKIEKDLEAVLGKPKPKKKGGKK